MTKHPETRQRKERLLRWTLIAAGTFSVGLGVLGVFLPLLPTTPFLLLAAACYARSSKRFYDWLLTNRWFGTHIRNYRERRRVPLRVKIWILALLWVTIGISALLAVETLWIRILLGAIAVGVTVHVCSIATLKR